MSGYFKDIAPIGFDPETEGPAFRHYNPDEIVLGKRMEDQLRFAVAYWHSFVWEGGDPFGGRTFDRPWFPADTMELAKRRAEDAFDLFRILGVPFFCFHDHDVRPEGASLVESRDRLNVIADIFQEKMAAGGPRLLWGTANLFFEPPLHVRRRHEPRSRNLRLFRRDGARLSRRDAPAERRELCALGRSRGL